MKEMGSWKWLTVRVSGAINQTMTMAEFYALKGGNTSIPGCGWSMASAQCPECGQDVLADNIAAHAAGHGYYWTNQAKYGYAKAEIDPADGKLKFVNQ